VRISDGPCAPIQPVKITRVALGYEQLRARADAWSARTGKRANAFLCNMGPLKEHKARADFSRGFLAAGGFEAISPEGFKSPEDAAAAFAASGAPIAVICSTDANYPALVPPLVLALRAQRPDALILLAGYPADQVEAFKKAGVDDFIHIRADVLATLSQLQKKLGIE
jgi:methylmalonyl-CoA mutase